MNGIRNIIISCSAAVLVMVSTGCEKSAKHPGYEYMPDMYRGVGYETYMTNPNFKDSSNALTPPKGAIKRGDDNWPYPYAETNEGYEAAGLELKNPLAITAAYKEEGKVLYNNYCVHCHGEKGMGDGAVTQNNGPKPPAYNSDQLKDLSEGKMFHSIHYGKNAMGGHASQLTKTERWKIIMYIQDFQKGGVVSAPADTTANKKV
ncbi:MAG: hypothetical protein RIQ89_1546 [Bacteroidota bacterium]|jgi:mono/diheme cytochrome c family protein